MKRRHFLSRSAATVLTMAASLRSRASVGNDQIGRGTAFDLARPSADQLRWQDLELGLFVHIAPNTWQDLESDDLSTPLSRINPKALDTDQWARTAVAMGARYLLFVAKHQGGFCMWQTGTTDYGIRNTAWKGGHGDVLAEVAASCRRHGLKLGVYLCPRDDHFGAKTGGVCATPELQVRYDAMYRQQLTEVLTRYGPIAEVWFDGSVRTPVADLLRRYQPHAIVFQGPAATIRWVGNEDGYAPYPCWNGISIEDAKSGTATALNGDPDGAVWLPNEVDVSIRRPDWFWSTTNASKVLSVDKLLSIYYRSVGRGAQLLVNIPANRDGLLSMKDCDVAKQFGTEIQTRFHSPAASVSGQGSRLLLPFSAQQRVDTVILQEDISAGERVRRFTVEGRKGTRWQTIGAGSAIGHKRILPITPDQFDSLRLTISEHVGVPRIRTFAAFDTARAAPPDWDAPTEVWSIDLVGHWKNGVFALDLTKKITAAAQYRLRFVPMSDGSIHLRDVSLRLRGVRQTSLMKTNVSLPNEVILNMTETGGEILISGRVEGPPEGSIVLQKL